MKNKFLLVACLVIMLGCRKHKEDKININIPVSSIVATIDGVETSFNTETYATLDTIQWDFGRQAVKLSIRGKKDANSNSGNILIWFFVTPVKQINPGTYPDLNKQIYQYLELNSLWNDTLYNYGSNRYGDSFYSSKSTIVRIDSLVQGVFSGNVGIGAGAESVQQPPLYHKITSGQFNVRIIN